MINKKINTTNFQEDVSKNWIPSQELINKDKKIRFLKTHNAMCTINKNKFTDKKNTKAAIYIVRDPRNVITSISNHYEFDIKYIYRQNSLCSIPNHWCDHFAAGENRQAYYLLVKILG